MIFVSAVLLFTVRDNTIHGWERVQPMWRIPLAQTGGVSTQRHVLRIGILHHHVMDTLLNIRQVRVSIYWNLIIGS